MNVITLAVGAEAPGPEDVTSVIHLPSGGEVLAKEYVAGKLTLKLQFSATVFAQKVGVRVTDGRGWIGEWTGDIDRTMNVISGELELFAPASLEFRGFNAEGVTLAGCPAALVFDSDMGQKPLINRTDEDGVATFRGLSASSGRVLVAGSPGEGLREVAAFNVGVGERRRMGRLELSALDPQRTISGLVVDERGSGVEGAVAMAMMEFDGTESPPYFRRGGAASAFLFAISGPGGYFDLELPTANPSQTTVHFHAPVGSAESEVAHQLDVKGGDEFTVVLHKDRLVKIQVDDDGSPGEAAFTWNGAYQDGRWGGFLYSEPGTIFLGETTARLRWGTTEVSITLIDGTELPRQLFANGDLPDIIAFRVN